MLTQERLKELLHYDPETGAWTWLISLRGPIRAGMQAGTVAHNGYLAIKIAGRVYGAHRLAFLYMLGRYPVGVVDHANRIRHDNAWHNLRECSQSENLANAVPHSQSGAPYKGISFDKRRGKWVASISAHKKRKHLGQFDTPEAAHDAYRAAAQAHYGQYARGSHHG